MIIVEDKVSLKKIYKFTGWHKEQTMVKIIPNPLQKAAQFGTPLFGC